MQRIPSHCFESYLSEAVGIDLCLNSFLINSIWKHNDRGAVLTMYPVAVSGNFIVQWYGCCPGDNGLSMAAFLTNGLRLAKKL